MRKSHLLIRKCICLMMVLLVILSCGAVSLTASADETTADYTKVDKVYDIAVAYDNSGSMYKYDDRWCEAKYAMEIFANMMELGGQDRLTIFPMWQVTTNKDKSNPSYGPVVIDSVEDISKLTYMTQYYDGSFDGTPFAPVLEASDYLNSDESNPGAEKWLIVLTDGEFYDDTREDTQKSKGDKAHKKTPEEVHNKLMECVTEDVNVYYIGFGEASTIESGEGLLVSPDKDVQKSLITACNTIFGRKELSHEYLSGSNLTLPVSMRSLIVFVQGDNAKVNSLKSPGGADISIASDSGQIKPDVNYSTTNATKFGGDYDVKFNDSLVGQLVTFGSCPVEGEGAVYKLNVSDNVKKENIQIFYEPNVVIKAELRDTDGFTIDPMKERVTPGEYQLYYYLADAITGRDLTGEEFMGKVKELDFDLTNSQGESIKYKDSKDSQGRPIKIINLDTDPEYKVFVELQYLDDYIIRTDDQLEGLKIEVTENDKLSVKATCQQPDSWYPLVSHDSWQPIRVDLAYNGQPLTEEQMASLELTVSNDETVTYRYERIPGESAFNVYPEYKETEEGTFPTKGNHKLLVTAKTQDEFGEDVKGKDAADFEVHYLSKGVTIFIIAAIVTLALLLFVIFMSQKVLPNKMTCTDMSFVVNGKSINGSKASYDKKGKRIVIRSVAVPANPHAKCDVTFDLRPASMRWVPSKNRKFYATVKSASSFATRIGMTGSYFSKENGKWISENEEELFTSPTIEVSASGSRLECNFEQ